MVGMGDSIRPYDVPPPPPKGVAVEVADQLTPPNVEPNGISDRHLAHLNDLIEKMSQGQLGQVFALWREHPAAAKTYSAAEYPVCKQGHEEIEELHGLHGIDWGMLGGAADRLANLSRAGDPLDHEVKALQVRLDRAWTGQAADAARQRYASLTGPVDRFRDTARKFSDELRKAIAVPRELIANGRTSLSRFPGRSNFWKLYGRMDNPDDIVKDIRGMWQLTQQYQASVESLENRGEFGERVRPRIVHNVRAENPDNTPDPDTGTHLGETQLTWDELRLPGSPGCRGSSNRDDDRTGTPAHERIRWLDDFCAWYALDVRMLRQRIHEAYMGTLEAWNGLASSLEGLDADPFRQFGQVGDAASPPPTVSTPSTATESSSGTSSTASGESGGRGHAGASQAGGTAGGSGTPAVRAAAAEVSPQAASSRAASPGIPHPPPGMAPAPPPQTSALPSAQPTPGAPMAARPGEQVTVGEGRNRMSVQRPDRNGDVKLTVPGDNGQPKAYEIGFSRGGEPGGQPPTPGQVSVGSDGTAVIHDGDRLITVAQEPSGQLKLNVIPGDGPPQSYSVAFGQAAPAPHPHPGPGHLANDPVTRVAPGVPVSPVAPDQPLAPDEAAPPDASGRAEAAAEPDLSATDATPAAGASPANIASATASQSVGFGTPDAANSTVGAPLVGPAGKPFSGADHDGRQWAPPGAPRSGTQGIPSMGEPGVGPSHGTSGLAAMGHHPPGPAPEYAGASDGRPGAADGSSMAGMGAMGAMGGMGARGGGGQRGHSQWRPQGKLFDDIVDDHGAGYGPVLGAEDGGDHQQGGEQEQRGRD